MDGIDNPDGSVTFHTVGPKPATWERYLTFEVGYEPSFGGGDGRRIASDIKVPIPHAERYAWQVRSATESQGLGDLIRLLDTWGIHHRLEQTGGFCMCVSVDTGDGGTLVAGGDPDTFGYYPGDSWSTGEYPEHMVTDYKSRTWGSRSAEFVVALYDRHGGPAGGTVGPPLRVEYALRHATGRIDDRETATTFGPTTDLAEALSRMEVAESDCMCRDSPTGQVHALMERKSGGEWLVRE